MNDFVIVIPNKYPELARNLIGSIIAAHDPPPHICVVTDNHKTQFDAACSIEATGPFVYAKSVNLGINAYPNYDVVLCNDDCECMTELFFFRLRHLAYQYQNIGILSPLIDGGVGNEWQQFPPIAPWTMKMLPEVIGLEQTICFPCVYIKRQVIQQVGVLDEEYTNYGFDDDDYCARAREAGWITAVTKSLHIKHGTGGNVLDRGKNWSVSFAKEETPRQSNIEVFLRKHPQLAAR